MDDFDKLIESTSTADKTLGDAPEAVDVCDSTVPFQYLCISH